LDLTFDTSGVKKLYNKKNPNGTVKKYPCTMVKDIKYYQKSLFYQLTPDLRKINTPVTVS